MKQLFLILVCATLALGQEIDEQDVQDFLDDDPNAPIGVPEEVLQRAEVRGQRVAAVSQMARYTLSNTPQFVASSGMDFSKQQLEKLQGITIKHPVDLIADLGLGISAGNANAFYMDFHDKDFETHLKSLEKLLVKEELRQRRVVENAIGDTKFGEAIKLHFESKFEADPVGALVAAGIETTA